MNDESNEMVKKDAVPLAPAEEQPQRKANEGIPDFLKRGNKEDTRKQQEEQV